MTKLFRFKSHTLQESDIFNKQIIRIDNTYSAEFYGSERYEIRYYPEEELASIVFSNGAIKYYRLDAVLSNENNPLAEFEDGKLLSFLRHVIYGEEYNKSSFVDSYTAESACEAGCDKMRRFLFSLYGGSYTVTYDIDDDGFIVMTLPERKIIGTPVQISASGALGDIETLFGGRLFHKLKEDYYDVTGKDF